ncbi:dCTP deaminase [bacterium]|nr:dCTP deaminase [bacterium]
MSTSSKNDIMIRLKEPVWSKKSLVVEPLLDMDDQLGPSSVDLRLGYEFIVFRRSMFDTLDLKDIVEDGEYSKYYHRVRLGNNEDLVLHPRQLILGSTFEFVKIPNDTNASVLSKSTWGRMGLLIATATNVDPGFRGCITLELVNMGEVPIKLRPGLRIAQLLLHTLSESEDVIYSGKYISPVGPEFPKFSKMQYKNDWKYFYKL